MPLALSFLTLTAIMPLSEGAPGPASLLAQGRWQEAGAQAAALGSSEGYALAAQASWLGGSLGGAEAATLFGKAEQYATRATQLDPQNAAAYLELGRAQNRLMQSMPLLRSLSMARKARQNLEQARTLQPNLAEIYLELGEWHSSLDQRGFLAKSASNARRDQISPNFEKALALEPGRVSFRLEYARALLQLGERARARTQLEKALSLNPSDYWERLAQQQARELLAGL